MEQKRERVRHGPLRKIVNREQIAGSALDRVTLECGHSFTEVHREKTAGLHPRGQCNDCRLEREAEAVEPRLTTSAAIPAEFMFATASTPASPLATATATYGVAATATEPAADNSPVLNISAIADEQGSLATIVERLIGLAGVTSVNVTATVGRVKLNVTAERVP